MFLPRLLACLFALSLAFSAPARATTLLRDADIEYALGALAAPILSAAGLSPSQVRIVLVDDSSLNAFVIDHGTIFLHSGLVLKLRSAAQLQAVIAHEAAHITNGHIARRLGNMRTARNVAGLGLLLAAATAASTGNNDAAAGIALGSQSAALRRFLSHTRAEEASADISSIRYMRRAGVDPRAAVEVLHLFRGQEALSAGRQDPYMRTHPLTRDRMRAVEGLVAGLPATDADPGSEYWFARAQGKLSAFKRAPGWTLRRLGDSRTQDIALMRQAVAYHRQPDTGKALAAIDKAIALRPRDPYLLELKGQILLESRNFDAAVAVYTQAARLAPREPLILGGLGRSLLATGNYGEALQALEAARGRDFSDARILRDLAVAYARRGNNGMASVVTAERYALRGRLSDAALHAKRAEELLPRGSAAWQRAQDVLSAAQQAQRR